MIDKLKTALVTILGGSTLIIWGVLPVGLSLMGGILHMWTIFIAYHWSGFFAAVVTACLPIISQIFWILKLWKISGTFFTLFCVVCLIYVGLWLLIFIAHFIGKKLTDVYDREDTPLG